MRILHTADWHIGKRLDRFSRIEEQRAVLEEIAEIARAEDVDLAIVAGDLYDVVNPGSDAEELLYEGLVKLSGDGKRPVVAIAGNHDSPDRVMAADVLAKERGIILIGYPHGTVSSPRRSNPVSGAGSTGEPRDPPLGYSLSPLEPGVFEIRLASAPGTPIRIVATPYANEVRLKRALLPGGSDPTAEPNAGVADAPGTDPSDDTPSVFDKDSALTDLLQRHWGEVAQRHLGTGSINLLITHLFFAGDPVRPPAEPEGERSIAHVGAAPPIPPTVVPAAYQYVACGHLHRPHTLGAAPPVRYAGSPLSYSFAEAGQQKSVTIVDLEPSGDLGAEPSIRTVPLTAGYPLLRYTAGDIDEAVHWLQGHRDAYVELRIHVSSFLSGTDRNRLHESHSRLVAIVPLIPETGSADVEDPIDPTGGLEELFTRYVTDHFGSPPGEELIGLFREVAGTTEDGTEVRGDS